MKSEPTANRYRFRINSSKTKEIITFHRHTVTLTNNTLFRQVIGDNHPGQPPSFCDRLGRNPPRSQPPPSIGDEAPSVVRMVVRAEGVSPSHWGRGLVRGLNSSQKFLSQIGQFWCILKSFLKLFMSCCLCIKLHIRKLHNCCEHILTLH